MPNKKKEYAPSEELIQYLMSTESFLDRPSNKLDGKWTIGFGDTDKALNDYYLKNPKARYSRKDAEKRLRERVSNEFLPQLAKTVPNWDRLTDAQKDSLLSYAYNVGKYFVSTHKNFAKAMQDFDLARAAAELNASENDRRYPGIKTRRAMEKAAFLDPSISVFGESPSKERPVASSYDWNSAPWYRYPVSSGEGPSINMTPVKMRSDDEIFGVRDTRGPLSYDVSAPVAEPQPAPAAPVQPKMSNVDMVLSEYLPAFQRGVLLQTYGNMQCSGGKIHIKPENRGKFTALKERTGHSASWFKAHGTPAQKKMATFALNAKKWKHADGGYLDGDERLKKLVDRINSTSNADFVRRLIDKRRASLSDENNNTVTHRMAYVDDGNGNAVVYPEVQNENGKLIWLTGRSAYDNAVRNKDTVHMSTEDAELFTKGYKKYYPFK